MDKMGRPAYCWRTRPVPFSPCGSCLGRSAVARRHVAGQVGIRHGAGPASRAFPIDQAVRDHADRSETPADIVSPPILRVAILLNSRSHSTELDTAAQNSQSPVFKLTVENASCRKGV